ncbi:chemotaxis protein CheW [bacterium BMS3Abin10]|nr:chemotaxis protein CheW [bacterium BMS3Abin10]GBE38737.1 chemotaxis protein CheW [bacterium BMS3Bbin08]
MSKYTVFTIAGEEFGIELGRVVEVMRPQKATPLPKVPYFVDGVINLRGTIIPVMDLRKRLNVKPSSRKERIIVTKMHGEKMGILVDSVTEIIDIDDSQIAPSPSIFKGLKPEYMSGIGKVKKRLIVILSLDNLLTSEEMIMLDERKEELSPEDLS